MQSPVYSSDPLRLTPHACIDVHADADTVVLGYLGDRVTSETHTTPDQADAYADMIHAAAAAARAARQG